MLKSIFKAYDIRGRYPAEINEQIIGEIAMSLARFFTSQGARHKVHVVIGHDARLSSPVLYRAALTGIKKYELRIKRRGNSRFIHHSLFIIPAGPCSTPMLYFLVNHFKAAGGIMITASHNPPEYNGLKVVKAKAEPMSGKEIQLLITND